MLSRKDFTRRKGEDDGGHGDNASALRAKGPYARVKLRWPAKDSSALGQSGRAVKRRERRRVGDAGQRHGAIRPDDIGFGGP